MVALSRTANSKYKAARTEMTFGEWVTRLSALSVSTSQIAEKKKKPFKNLKNTPIVRRKDLSSIPVILKECELMLCSSLECYAEARRRVEIK